MFYFGFNFEALCWQEPLKYMNAEAKGMMLIDSGAPKSIVSSRWLEGYLRDVKVSNEDIKKGSYARRFRLEKTVYLC